MGSTGHQRWLLNVSCTVGQHGVPVLVAMVASDTASARHELRVAKVALEVAGAAVETDTCRRRAAAGAAAFGEGAGTGPAGHGCLRPFEAAAVVHGQRHDDPAAVERCAGAHPALTDRDRWLVDDCAGD